MANLQPYINDLEGAGAGIIDVKDDERGAKIHVEFGGSWAYLSQYLGQNYNKCAEMRTADSPTRFVLEPL